MKRFLVACEDTDPEEQCPYSAEGLSMAEVIDKLFNHVKIYHVEKLASLSSEEVDNFETRMRQSLKIFAGNAGPGV
ncbi:MAG: hypothetical protein A2901_05500 [Elusimicrobia bacterium RIFCSPLOWO2_01_FULL_54_10]|nr:MAG: hypothetical protein A2901_05500 [Elusimicrobia bacterium RIFCSPLOWO2_01_FULL_54_10]